MSGTNVSMLSSDVLRLTEEALVEIEREKSSMLRKLKVRADEEALIPWYRKLFIKNPVVYDYDKRRIEIDYRWYDTAPLKKLRDFCIAVGPSVTINVSVDDFHRIEKRKHSDPYRTPA